MTNIILALTLVIIAQQGPSDVSVLFKTFRNSSDASYPIKQPSQPIKVYATDDLNTKICYISDDVIYIYSNGRVGRPLYAKVFNVKAVNRITYKKLAAGGVFQIWIDDELVLSISS